MLESRRRGNRPFSITGSTPIDLPPSYDEYSNYQPVVPKPSTTSPGDVEPQSQYYTASTNPPSYRESLTVPFPNSHSTTNEND